MFWRDTPTNHTASEQQIFTINVILFIIHIHFSIVVLDATPPSTVKLTNYYQLGMVFGFLFISQIIAHYDSLIMTLRNEFEYYSFIFGNGILIELQ